MSNAKLSPRGMNSSFDSTGQETQNSKLSLTCVLLLASFSHVLWFYSPVCAFGLPAMPEVSTQQNQEVGGVDTIAKSSAESAEEAYTGRLAITPEGITDGIGDPNTPRPKQDDRKINYRRSGKKTDAPRAGTIKTNRIYNNRIDNSEKRSEAIKGGSR